MRPLPAGVSPTQFNQALHEFGATIGAEWVFSKDEDVALYDDSYTPFPNDPSLQLRASAAVAPASVEQVQQIVRIANKYKTPLYPISTGRNLGYGGSSPTYDGCVIVDLKRMNRVLEVNVREGYMIVEPGLSFIDLQRHFDEHDYPFVIATPDPGWGSPIGNALDHGTSPQVGDNFGMVQGVEVVLPNAELLRTGMGGVGDSHLWANYRYGFGPVLYGIFSQSNFGIVTKAVFWLVRKPETQRAFTVKTYRQADLEAMVETVQMMRESGLITDSAMDSPIRRSMATNDGRQPFGPPKVRELHARADGGSIAEWEQLARDSHIPVGQVSGSARGPKTIVQATLEYAREQFSKIPGLDFSIGEPVVFDKNYSGRPRIEFGELGVQPTSRGHYYFSPMFKATVEDMFAINDTIRRVMLEAGDLDMLANFGWSAGWGLFHPKCALILMEFLIHDDAELNRKRRKLFLRLVAACGAKGWAEYRAPVAFQSDVMRQYNFGNYAIRRFNETIKDAIDPNGILAPGKSGIWPKHLRKA